jgi:hypothetical protein
MSSILSKLSQFFGARALSSRKLQADIDFSAASSLLELNEKIIAGERDVCKIMDEYSNLQQKWRAAKLSEKIIFANDSSTIQLAEMFQHLYDVDAGDTSTPVTMPQLSREERRSNAAFKPSIGPSTHTNPLPTLQFQMKSLHEDAKSEAETAYRNTLTDRIGFSLWIGPSQASTPKNFAGVYIKGKAYPGSVVALFPGAVYSEHMLITPQDGGHLGNPLVKRQIIPRFDGAIIDVHAANAPKTNPFAVAHHVRHPPPQITPNVMRVPIDFVADDDGTKILPFPKHLRDYIPNVWGSSISTGQQLHSMLEQNIWMKGMILIALRPLWNEELYVDHSLNPSSKKLPEWYKHVDELAAKRIWKGISE